MTVELSADLVRYPFRIEHERRLPADESTLYVEESITNEGRREVPYIWQHHIVLGQPLVGPEARLDVPADTGVVNDYGSGRETNRLAGDETFEWPEAPGIDGDTVDISEFPTHRLENPRCGVREGL